MDIYRPGHLDCLFDCGLSFSSLETLHLHIELDHREDNDVSPFLARPTTSPVASSSRDTNVPPLPTRPPPRVPIHEEELQGSRDSEAEPFTLCPEPHCGEQILLIELNEHLDLHEAESLIDEGSISTPDSNRDQSQTIYSSLSMPSESGQTYFSTDVSPALLRKMDRRPTDGTSPRVGLGRKFLSIIGMEKKEHSRPSHGASKKNIPRLSKDILGPYAHETQMPKSLYQRLKDGPKITRTKKISRQGGLVVHESVDGETPGVLPILKRLIEHDHRVGKAFLCHPSVTQIGKFHWEGGFCGYRNAQMQISYMQHAKHPSSIFFPGRTPGILELQDHIEQAWDNGRHPYARQEVGKLKGTRKWIGTLEVHAIYQNLDIPCEVHQFSDSTTTFADESLLDWVQAYFESAAMPDKKKVQCTLKPPVYLQRPGHSLTIVGLEIMRDGTRNLLVFDPMYQAPKLMREMVDAGPRRIVNAHHSTSPDVYAFFDVSTCHYEVYRTDAFHDMFPWYLCGAKFDADLARFERQTVMPGAMDASLWRGFCVPQAFSRWVPGADGAIETTKLSYDDWKLPKAAETYECDYWNSETSVLNTSGLDYSYVTLPNTADTNGPECWEFDESWMDTNGIASPCCPEFEQLKEELLDCGYDLPSYPELRSLRKEFLRCGSGGPVQPPPVQEFMEEFVSPQESNRDGWACLKAEYMNEFVPGLHDGGDGNFVFTISVNPDTEDMWFRLSAPSMYSWVAVGSGTSMEGSNMIVAYEGAKDNTVTLSSRKATGRNEPSYMESYGLQSVKSTVEDDPHGGDSSIYDDTYFINGFVPEGATKFNINPDALQNFIFAVGPQGHEPRTDAKDGPLRRHAFYGSFQLDMKQAHGTEMPLLGIEAAGTTSRTPSFNKDREYRSSGHAFVMGLTFAIIFPLGVFFLRILEKVSLHIYAQTFGLFLVIIGVFSGFVVSRSYNRSKNFSSPHQIIGLVIFLLILVQWTFGFLHHRTYLKTQTPTWMIKPHKFILGPLIMVLGLVNVALGFRFAVAGQDNLYYVPLVITVTLLMAVAFGAKTFLAKKRTNRSVPFSGSMPGNEPYAQPAPAYEVTRPYVDGYAGTRSDIQLGHMGDPPIYSQQPQKPATFL
ncbi:Serine/threonine-protein kinase [Venturia nashicola]|nr:Serine/threonine-protein kinase [Venturia nashicola]